MLVLGNVEQVMTINERGIGVSLSMMLIGKWDWCYLLYTACSRSANITLHEGVPFLEN